MKTSRELKEKRGQVQTQLREMHELATKEKRSFTAEEKTSWDQRSAELDALDAEIEDAEKREKTIGKLYGGGADNGQFGKKDQQEIRKFSFAKAIKEGRGSMLTGVEKEVHDEGLREMRENNQSATGNGIAVPSFMYRVCSTEERAQMVAAEKRDLTVTGSTSTTGDQGGFAVQKDVMGVIPALKPAVVMADLGATILNGLVGNLRLPRNTNVVTAGWEGEVTDADEAAHLFDYLDLTPKRLAAFSKPSVQLLSQQSIISENWIRAELENAIARAIEAAAINGSGSSNQPTGILNTSGIGSVAGGTNGAIPTFANMVDLEKALAANDALQGNLGYLVTPGMLSKLKGVDKTSGGFGQYIATKNGNAYDINGYKAAASSLVPSTLTKGTSSGVCHASIFGNWSELIIAQWQGMYIVVDDLTLAGNAQVKITVNTWNDIAVKHVKSFAAMKDGLIA